MTNYTQWKSLVDLHEYSAIPDSPIGQNTIAYYSFDDDADTTTLSDQVGTFDGTISGMSYVTDEDAGRVVGEFDGDDDEVVSMGIPSLSAYSVGIIVKPLNVSDWDDFDTVFSFRDNNTFEVHGRPDNGNFEYVLFHGGEDNNELISSQLVENELQTVVLRWDGSTINFSVDSENAVSTSESSMDNADEADGFGANQQFTPRFANMRLVHFEISDEDEGQSFEDDFHNLI